MSLDEEISTESFRRSKRLGSVPLLRRNKTNPSVDLSTSIVPEDLELPVDNEAISPLLDQGLFITHVDMLIFL